MPSFHLYIFLLFHFQETYVARWFGFVYYVLFIILSLLVSVACVAVTYLCYGSGVTGLGRAGCEGPSREAGVGKAGQGVRWTVWEKWMLEIHLQGRERVGIGSETWVMGPGPWVGDGGRGPQHKPHGVGGQ